MKVRASKKGKAYQEHEQLLPLEEEKRKESSEKSRYVVDRQSAKPQAQVPPVNASWLDKGGSLNKNKE